MSCTNNRAKVDAIESAELSTLGRAATHAVQQRRHRLRRQCRLPSDRQEISRDLSGSRYACVRQSDLARTA
jgi:hypothetical protein